MHGTYDSQKMLCPFRISGKIIIDKHDVLRADSLYIRKHIFDFSVDVLAVLGTVITEITAKRTASAGMDHVTVQILALFNKVISGRYDLISGKRFLAAVNRL